MSTPNDTTLTGLTELVRAYLPHPARAHRVRLDTALPPELMWLYDCRAAWLVTAHGRVVGLLARDRDGWRWAAYNTVDGITTPSAQCPRVVALRRVGAAVQAVIVENFTTRYQTEKTPA